VSDVFRELEIVVKLDGQPYLKTDFPILTDPEPRDLAPAVAAFLLRYMAGKLDDLMQAKSLGLSTTIALQMAGMRTEAISEEGPTP